VSNVSDLMVYTSVELEAVAEQKGSRAASPCPLRRQELLSHRNAGRNEFRTFVVYCDSRRPAQVLSQPSDIPSRSAACQKG
jgi:hypothetical protein